MSLKFPPHGSVHENRIKPLPLSLLECTGGNWGRGFGYRQSRWVQTCWKTSSTEPSALSWVQRGLAGGLARGLSSESNWNSSKDAFWPSLEGVMLGMRGVKPTPNQAELSLPAFLIIPSHHFPSPGKQAPSCGAGGY